MQPPLYAPPQPPASSGAGSTSAGNTSVQSFPLGKTSAPVPPQLPIGPGQARFTTFASRARLGVSTLMQPLPQGPDLHDQLRTGSSGYGIDYGTTDRTRGGGLRRRAAAGMRYYGEDASDFDEDDEGDDDNAGTQSPSKRNTPLQVEEEDFSHGALLGLPPPGNKVIAKRAHRTHPLVASEADLLEQANKKEFLIPVKIELETDNHRIRDVFAWNLKESIIKPRDFARVYVRDLELPAEPYVGLVEQAILDQIQLVENSGVDLVEIGPAPGGPWASKPSKTSKKRERDSRGWDWGLKRGRNTSSDSKKAITSGGKDEEAGGKKNQWNPDGPLGGFDDDLRVILDYDVQIYRHHLRDRLEWDLSSPLTPDAFALQMCKDLCLTGEALPIISNAVREQLLIHMRSAIDLDLVGKGAEYAKWQQEIDDAEHEMAENRRRNALGLPALPLKPLQMMHEEPEEEQQPEVLGPRRRMRPSTYGEDTAPSSVLDESSAAATRVPTPSRSGNLVLRTPAQRRGIAEYFQFQLTEKGPRKLEGAWREYHESREFGPLLERLTDADLERIEADAMRASRRGRRDQQRSSGRRRR